MSKIVVTKIRPAARLIGTIGEDLIGDAYAAVVELVKNSYDADASFVNITFTFSAERSPKEINIEIADDGHGMTQGIVLASWLVPATKSKVSRSESPKGRLFQGKKGIGRYAAAILGQELTLLTTDGNQNTTEVIVDWTQFEQAEYLDDVDIVVSSEKSNRPPGTTMFIKATGDKYDQWGSVQLEKLTNELRKLKSPLKEINASNPFSINLAFIDCPFEQYNGQIFEIESFPITELFDYRISGTITNDGEVKAVYENKVEPDLPIDRISFHIDLGSDFKYCGPIDFDLRVFDRDPEAISNLIDKGLINPITQHVVGKREARQLLDEVYGVNLYREGFRIRPYGNGGIDWLDLDKDRIQNFSLRISNNQIVGFVNIKPEKISGLQEKSGRDGLKENQQYFGLISQLKAVLNELESRRFEYRQKTGKGRKGRNVHSDVENLFDYTVLTGEINRKLKHLNIDARAIKEIATIIQRDSQRKSKLLEEIQNTIAVYQGQATLGKIVTVLLHEGRKPVNYIKQQSPNLSRWLIHYKAQRKWDDDLYDDILKRLVTMQEQGAFLADLFRRLDPLAKQNRGSRSAFNIKHALEKTLRIFENSLHNHGINYSVDCEPKLEFIGWEEDLLIALTNLIENSIYWLDQSTNVDKRINIEVVDNLDLIIHYRDNGPGISKETIESGVIFEPGFSKKIGGTGLGLAIAGEALERLGGIITAHHSPEGAYFTIELKNNSHDEG